MADKNIIEDLEMRIQGNSKSLVFARLADLYIDEGKIDEALQICEEGIRQNPDYITGFYILAKIHLKKQNFTEAEEALKKVISHDNEFLSAHKLLGDLMLQMGFENKAAQHYKEMLRIDPFDEATDSLLRSIGDTEIDYREDLVDEEDRSSIRPDSAAIAASDDWIHEINEVFPDEVPAVAEAELNDPLAMGNDEIDEMFDTLDEKPKPSKKQATPSFEEESFESALDHLTEADISDEEETLGNISDTPSFVNLGDFTDEEDVLKTKDRDLADLISHEKNEENSLNADESAFDDEPLNPNELIQNIPDLEESDSSADDWEDAFNFESVETDIQKTDEKKAEPPGESTDISSEPEEDSDWSLEEKPASDTLDEDAFVFDAFEEPALDADQEKSGESGHEDLTWDAFSSEELPEETETKNAREFEAPFSEDAPKNPAEELPDLPGMETEPLDETSKTDLSEDSFIFEPPDESPGTIESPEETEDSGAELAFATELSFEESAGTEPESGEADPAKSKGVEDISEDDLNFPSQFEDLTFETTQDKETPSSEERPGASFPESEEEPGDEFDIAAPQKETGNIGKSKLPPINFDDDNFKDVFQEPDDQSGIIDNTLRISPDATFTETTGFRESTGEDEQDQEPFLEDDSRELADIVRESDQPVSMQPERDAMTPAPPKPAAPVSSDDNIGETDVMPHKIVTPTLGEIYAAQGQFSKAIEIYEELLSQNPGEIKYRNKIDELKQKLNESL